MFVYISNARVANRIRIITAEHNHPPKMSLHTTRILGVKAFWRSIVWEISVREQWPKMMKMHGSCLKLGAPTGGARCKPEGFFPSRHKLLGRTFSIPQFVRFCEVFLLGRFVFSKFLFFDQSSLTFKDVGTLACGGHQILYYVKVCC